MLFSLSSVVITDSPEIYLNDIQLFAFKWNALHLIFGTAGTFQVDLSSDQI